MILREDLPYFPSWSVISYSEERGDFVRVWRGGFFCVFLFSPHTHLCSSGVSAQESRVLSLAVFLA